MRILKLMELISIMIVVIVLIALKESKHATSFPAMKGQLVTQTTNPLLFK